MEERLKSISRRIHWSLLLRAGVFGFAWLLLPFSLFVLVALYLYFSPLAQSRGLAWSFFVLLLLMFLEPVGPLFAVIFGAIFFYILLIKEFVLIDRASAHEVTVLALSFLLIRRWPFTPGKCGRPQETLRRRPCRTNKREKENPGRRLRANRSP